MTSGSSLVVIVGAGPTGLAAATLLALYGTGCLGLFRAWIGAKMRVRPRLRRGLAGRLCPNVPLGDGRRFDDVAGGRFALVTTTKPASALSADVERRGGALITANAGSGLHHWLRCGHATAAIVRPDGTVLRAGRDLSELCAAIPAFGAPMAHRAGSREG